MSSIMYQGAIAPEEYVLTVSSGDSGDDLSLVTVAKFEVQKPDGSVVEWSPAITSQTTTTLVLTFTFNAITSELDLVGPYSLYSKLSTPAGTIRSIPTRLTVKSKFDVT